MEGVDEGGKMCVCVCEGGGVTFWSREIHFAAGERGLIGIRWWEYRFIIK